MFKGNLFLSLKQTFTWYVMKFVYGLNLILNAHGNSFKESVIKITVIYTFFSSNTWKAYYEK